MKSKLAVATSMKDAVPASISSSTPVMASIMKEETENRELVSRHFIETTINRNKNYISGEKEYGDPFQKE